MEITKELVSEAFNRDNSNDDINLHKGGNGTY